MADVASPAELLALARDGDRAALARLLTVVERGGPDARALGKLTHPLGGSGYTIGITGAPGAGKSTLTNALIGRVRRDEASVAVLAIDPSSPFSGGAILGDRVRMRDHTADPGVFIRSMATRGHLGGLSLATLEAVRALDATGWPWIVIETVGVGQVEVEVAGAADTTIVVVNPGWGDAVQANKAGLLEIADIFVINKADRPGVEDTTRDLERMLDLTDRSGWRPPVVATTATTGAGVDDALGGHRASTAPTSSTRASWSRAEPPASATSSPASSPPSSTSAPSQPGGDKVAGLAAQVARRELDPWTAAEGLLP